MHVLKDFTTWICQKEMLVPSFALQLLHHALLLNQVIANHLNKVGVLQNYICFIFLLLALYFYFICHFNRRIYYKKFQP